MDGNSLNITQDLLEKLKELVPQAFSEAQLDLQKLQTLLGEAVNTDTERYQLSWAGKSEAYKVLQMPTTATLIPQPEHSVNWDESENIFIEGENLEVLKVLQKSYYGKIKMIYIDPPYNTGSDSFIYPDKFSETKEEYLKRIGEKDEDGYMMKEGLFRKNSKENGQFHSNWLNMMLPRLFLARNLLKDDGVIFISIDDNEQANLKLLMDEVFGEENFVGEMVWQKKTGAGAKTKGFITLHEYILCYAKNLELAGDVGTTISEKMKKMYSGVDEKYEKLGGFATWPLDTTSMDYRENLRYPIYHQGVEIWPKKQWLWSKERTLKAQQDNRLVFNFNKKENTYSVRFKGYLYDDDGNEKQGKPLSLLIGPYTQEGTKDFQEIFEREVFPFPKPVNLLKQLFKITYGQEGEPNIYLDFFSGSGTTAQAVLELNNEDNGDRKFICVQLTEATDETSEAYKAGYKTIADITQVRIKKVIEKIEKEREGKLEFEQKQPIGFRKYTLSPSNFKIWRGDLIENEAELTQQMELFVTPQRANAQTENILWELLIKNGVSLTEKVQRIELGEGASIYHTSDKRFAFVLDKFTAEVQESVLALKPRTVICLDSLFQNQDMVKTNAQLKMEDNGITFKTV
jgi:adenine-specific DNA-methyltransferase